MYWLKYTRCVKYGSMKNIQPNELICQHNTISLWMLPRMTTFWFCFSFSARNNKYLLQSLKLISWCKKKNILVMYVYFYHNCKRYLQRSLWEKHIFKQTVFLKVSVWIIFFIPVSLKSYFTVVVFFILIITMLRSKF